MQLETWLLYTLAAIGLSLSPGPNSLLAMTHGALHGTRMALFTILGGTFGFTLLIALSMFGIAALLQSSLAWLAILKWVGGAYLVWLGIQVWRSQALDLAVAATPERPSAAKLFSQGALSATTNPKGILFFAAFLPQFIDPHRSLFIQFVVMAGTFAVTEVLTEIGLASTAHRIRPWLARVGKRFNHACGGIFMAIGIALPLRT
jgi:threonine/homoserine/homoserine lactone efflux protein